ncbi:hypothetical protein [Halobaculum sp. EA56]|uniref:hypothetical protein n=1 Tax=Halobaculum sp. EA56 TaxID=3421648 RepID=UPI003EB8EFAE
MDPLGFAFGLLADLLGWFLAEAGLAGVISVGALLSGLTYAWWGFKLKTLIEAGAGIGATLAKHALVSTVAVVAALVALLWTGIVPGLNLSVAWNLLAGAFEFATGLLGVVA